MRATVSIFGLGKIGAAEIVAVRALDGRWNYGPATLADALKYEEFGTYPTAPEAWHAGRREKDAK